MQRTLLAQCLVLRFKLIEVVWDPKRRLQVGAVVSDAPRCVEVAPMIMSTLSFQESRFVLHPSSCVRSGCEDKR